jgi:hypothetical protein
MVLLQDKQSFMSTSIFSPAIRMTALNGACLIDIISHLNDQN